MSHPAIAILVRETGWIITGLGEPRRLDVPPGASVDQLAEATAQMLSGSAAAGQDIVLALPAAWCLSAGVVDDVPKKSRRTALLYKLEDHLPISAEDVVADFVGEGGRCLGVCCETRLAAPIVDALEKQGVPVRSVVPAALLALQELHGRQTPESFFLIADDDEANLFDLDGATITSWTLLAPVPDRIASTLRQAALRRGSDAKVRVVGPADLVSALRAAGVDVATHDKTSAIQLIAAGARSLLHGRPPLVELRRDGLGSADALRAVRTPLNAALAAGVVLLLVLSVALLVRASWYDDQRAVLERRMGDLYRDTFPGSRVPLNIPSRLKAERRSLEGQGAGGGGEVVQPSALQTFADVLGGMPPNVPYHLESIDVSADAFTLTGTIGDVRQIDPIAGAIRQSGGYTVPAPTMTRLPDTRWRFTLTGRSGQDNGAPMAMREAP